MNDELKITIGNLYTVFSSYPMSKTIAGCPCCVSDSDRKQIHSRPLRELNSEDLSRYAFKAMSTWGSVSDYKHYLPRIFELAATSHFGVDTFIVIGKLEYAKWESWPEQEQQAVRQFLLAWWMTAIQSKPEFDTELFTSVYQVTGDMPQLLERWTIDINDNSFLGFVDFIHTNYIDLKERRNDFKHMDSVAVDHLLKWIDDRASLLEKGFFYFTDHNNGLADKISRAQYIHQHS